MGSRVPESGELVPAQVISWLKTPAGERWSERRIGQVLESHWDDSGVFAEVIRDAPASDGKLARWPEPFPLWDLDDDRD